MRPASPPRNDPSIRFACDCTASSSQIRTPFPISLIVYTARRASSRAPFPRGTGYVGGCTGAALPSTGSSAWRYVSAARSSSSVSSLMDTVMSSSPPFRIRVPEGVLPFGAPCSARFEQW